MTDPIRLVFTSLAAASLLGIGILTYRYIYPKKKINLFVLLFFISVLPVISIFRIGTYQAGDLTLHASFLISFYDNLSQGNIIPQWSAGFCGTYGCPNLEFEYPLPYYISSIFHFIGFGYLNSIKIFLALSFILSGVGMFL